MQNLQKIFPKYSIALGALFLLTVFYLVVRGNTVEVESGEVRYRELVQAIYATGFVEANSVARLSSEYSGTVDFVGAREGESVRKGQKILRSRVRGRYLRLVRLGRLLLSSGQF